MEPISLLMLPIGLLPQDVDQFGVALYRPGGGWLSGTLARTETPDEAAARLLSSSFTPWPPDLSPPPPEPIGFTVVHGTVALVYTAAVPLAAVMGSLAATGEELAESSDWVALVEARVSADPGSVPPQLDPAHEMVRNYWRRQLEETTAAFDLLPQFFTTTQVRAVYASVWGGSQNPGTFHKWLHTSNGPRAKAGAPNRVGDSPGGDAGGVCVEAPEDTVREMVESTFTQQVARSPMAGLVNDPRALLSRRTVGVSPLLAAVGVGAAAMTAVPALGLALGVTAGLAAYQGRRAPGPDPQWYRRALTGRVLLREPYPPRPLWLPVDAVPSRFH